MPQLVRRDDYSDSSSDSSTDSIGDDPQSPEDQLKQILGLHLPEQQDQDISTETPEPNTATGNDLLDILPGHPNPSLTPEGPTSRSEDHSGDQRLPSRTEDSSINSISSMSQIAGRDEYSDSSSECLIETPTDLIGDDPQFPEDQLE